MDDTREALPTEHTGVQPPAVDKPKAKGKTSKGRTKPNDEVCTTSLCKDLEHSVIEDHVLWTGKTSSMSK
jgi:hypothetical protein